MSANSVIYRLYPSLLNCFDRYQKGYMSEESLINSINRVPVPQTEAQRKGVNFEEAVIKGINEELFDPELLSKARALLPRPMLKTQFYCEYQLNNVLVYGYVDVLGKMMAVDLKTASQYQPGKYLDNHQNFYLPALRAKGVRTLRYIVTDFTDVYVEDYDQSLDLSIQEKQVADFCDFIEKHRPDITDRRIFG